LSKADKQRTIRPWMVVLIVLAVYLFAVFAIHDYDPLVFVTLADGPAGDEGYDGQFTYHIAVDPISAPAKLDIPAYRMQRILLPVTAYVFSFGQAALVPWLLLVINGAALVGGTYLFEELLTAENKNRWFGLIYGLFPGLLIAVRLSVNEPLAFGLAVAAIWLYQQDKPISAAVTLALAGLTKEPALVFAGGFMLWLAVEKRWWEVIRLGLIAWVPYIIWQIVLTLWLGEPGFGSGGAGQTSFELIPFMGFFRILTDTGSLKVFLVFFLFMAPMVLFPGLWGLVSSIQSIARRSHHLYVYLLLANTAVMLIIPYSTYRETLAMLRFIPGLAITVILYSAHFNRARMLRYSLVWLGGLAFIAAA
jgi:hypothetical protein